MPATTDYGKRQTSLRRADRSAASNKALGTKRWLRVHCCSWPEIVFADKHRAGAAASIETRTITALRR
jgi:hypothetical protein